MKKLMLVAVTAVMVGGAFAAEAKKDKYTQVYKMRIAMRSTEAKTAEKINNPFTEGVDKKDVVYRDDATYVYNGMIWGCGCEAIQGKKASAGKIGTTNYWDGAMIWEKSSNNPLWVGDAAKGLDWQFLQAYSLNGKKAEGVFKLSFEHKCGADTETGELIFAGFGQFGRLSTATNTTETLNCTYYVDSISGEFAGYMPAFTSVKKGDVPCLHCDKGTEDTCSFSEAWDWCKCADMLDKTKTAAYGQWYIVYDADKSEALSSTYAFGKVYDFGGRSLENPLWKKYMEEFSDALK